MLYQLKITMLKKKKNRIVKKIKNELKFLKDICNITVELPLCNIKNR